MTTNDILTLIIACTALLTSIILTYTQIKISRAANSLPVGIDLLREYRSKEFKEKANHIYGLIKTCSDYNKLTSNQKLEIEYISHFFDVLGILVYKKVISKKLITTVMGENIEYSWSILHPYIQYQRNQRNNNNYQLGFEYLAKIASNNKKMDLRKKMCLD